MKFKTYRPDLGYEEWKVEDVMRVANCDRAMAWAYLEAEEWNVTEALTSLLGDRRLGFHTPAN